MLIPVPPEYERVLATAELLLEREAEGMESGIVADSDELWLGE